MKRGWQRDLAQHEHDTQGETRPCVTCGLTADQHDGREAHRFAATAEEARLQSQGRA